MLRPPPIRAPLEVQDWTSRKIQIINLGGLQLLPFYTIEQMKFAVIHHIRAFGDPRLVRKSHDAAGTLTLQKCIAQPFPKHHFRRGGPCCWRSCAYVVERTVFDGFAATEPFILILRHGSEVWVEVAAANMVMILKALFDGHGRLVVRFYWSLPTPWEHEEWRVSWKAKHRWQHGLDAADATV